MSRESFKVPEKISGGHLRWIDWRDHPRTLAMINYFSDLTENTPLLTEKQMVEMRRNTIGLVFEDNTGTVIGATAYRMVMGGEFTLEFFVVDASLGLQSDAPVRALDRPTAEQIAVGMMMLKKIWTKLEYFHWHRLVMLVPKTDERTLRLLSALDFLIDTDSHSKQKKFQNKFGENCYQMEYFGP